MAKNIPRKKANADLKRPRIRSLSEIKAAKLNGNVPTVAAAHVSTEKQEISALPPCICDVRSVIDEHGNSVNAIAIRARSLAGNETWTIFQTAPLVLGHYAALAPFVMTHGLVVFSSQKGLRELASLLIGTTGEPAFFATRDGYHTIRVDGSEVEFFVWRDQVYGLSGTTPPNVFVANGIPSLPPASGTLADWNREIGQHVVANPVMLVVVCFAISAPLVAWLRLPRAAFALVGPSACGKTTTQVVGNSVIEPNNGVQSGAGTERGVRLFLTRHVDRPACLDDIRQSEDLAGLVRLMFDVGNATARLTSTSDQHLAVADPMRCSPLLSNESTLAELIAGKRIALPEGAYSRLFEIVITAPNGIFATTPHGMTEKAFAEHLAKAATTFHGSFWNAWIPAISNNAQRISDSAKKQLPLLEAEIVDGLNISDPVTLRLVRALAGFAFAGFVAAKLELLPTNRETIVAAFRAVLEAHVKAIERKSTPLALLVLNHVAAIIDASSNKFPPIEQFHSTAQGNLLGFRKRIDGVGYFLFFKSAFDELIGEKFGTPTALRKLREAGLLRADNDSDQCQVRIRGNDGEPDQRKRFYAISEAVRFEGDD